MKKIPTYVLLVISFLFIGCDVNNKTTVQYDANVSKQESKSIEIPLVTTNPLDELDLSLYTNDGYKILGSHTWMENKTPTGIIVFCKGVGDASYNSRSKLYAIAFQYSPDNDTGKQWTIINETRFEEPSEYMEPIKDVIFLKLGTSNVGFATVNKNATQGFYGEGISIYALVNSNFSKIGGFNTLYQEGNDDVSEHHLDDKGKLVDHYGIEVWEQTSEIFMEQNASKSFYDIKVKNKIFKPRKLTSTKPAKEWEEIYIFKNGEYVSTK